MTLEQQKKLAAHIFRILKISDISFPIGRTNKGDLSLKFTKDKEGFEVILDAVPLNEKEYDNRELKSILTKYLFDSELTFTSTTSAGVSWNSAQTAQIQEASAQDKQIEANTQEKKKRGRPKGSKNT